MSHAYCPECGFQNPEAANYCARCGSYLRRDELGETTLSITPEEIEEGLPVEIRDLGSLNGTFVNRHRIESAVLATDDEVQIGKYRMTILLP